MSINKKDSLGDRMKGYENKTRIYLEPKTPVIIRLDGRAFHTITQGFDKPFDAVMTACMEQTLKKLCESVSGVLLGYTQSDEITLLLGDWANSDTQMFFNGNILKIASITASAATLAFNKALIAEIEKLKAAGEDASCYEKAYNTNAMFDSRCFNVPFSEVVNSLLWRQQDAIRNSKQAVAQANYSARALHGLNCDELVEKLKDELGIVWSDFPIYQQRGTLCERVEVTEEITYTIKRTQEQKKAIVTRNKWVLNHEMPLFSEMRESIEAMFPKGN